MTPISREDFNKMTDDEKWAYIVECLGEIQRLSMELNFAEEEIELSSEDE